MLRPSYPLRTARLILRPFAPDDLDDLFDIQSRPEVARFLYWEARDRDQVREALDAKTQESVLDEEGKRLTLAVVLPQSGTVIGEVMLRWLSREHRQGEVGFVFHPDHQGKGFATEAAAVALRLGFADLGLHRIIGRCDAQNLPSARVLERLGMRREAHFIHDEIFKGEWGDSLVYAILDHEWKARQAQASDGQRRQRSAVPTGHPSRGPLDPGAGETTHMDIEVATIREVTGEVIEAFTGLLPQLSRSARPLDRRALARIVSCPANTVLVARAQGQIVGTLTLVMFPIPSGLRARIEDVVVDARARGQGVGTALTQEALRLARGHGARTVDLTSRPSREAANRLYRRLGFQLRDSDVYRLTLDG